MAVIGTNAHEMAAKIAAGGEWAKRKWVTLGTILDRLNDSGITQNQLTALATKYVATTDAATYSVTAANSGVVFIVPNLTATCTFSMPTAAAGLAYEFVYGGVAADAQNWVIDTGADANFFLGGLLHVDTDAGSAGDEVVPIAGDGNSNSKLTVVTPDVGTRFLAVCDGTNWTLSGTVVSATVPSFADQ